MAEYVPGFEATIWNGVNAPLRTPPAIVDRLSREINAALADPEMVARITELGAAPLPGSSADYADLVAGIAGSGQGGRDVGRHRAVRRKGS